MLRPGSLNEVEEVDEDVSDDVSPSPRREELPATIHTESAQILEV